MIVPEKTIQLKSGLKLLLRSPQSGDAEVLLKHLRTQFHESYQNMNYRADYFDQFTVEQEAKLFADIVPIKNKFFISAFCEDRIIGNVGIFGGVGDFDQHSAKLGIGVQKEFHNLGIGRALMESALECAPLAGLTRIELTVRTHNPNAAKLYENCGFERVGLLKHAALIDGEYCDQILFQKILQR